MLAELRRIIEETVELTAAPPPDMLGQKAPVLSEAVLGESDGRPFYLVGLIGGKNVGKSSLVNALVGREIAARSSHGAGTEQVIAYAHEQQAEALRMLLDHEVPGRYEIVTHDVPELSRQVLLDLPDIDSHYASHAEITQRMLRHVLYPIWVQSVEKYADHKPRELLLEVVAGNTPQNLLFCLSKIDQVIDRYGEAAAHELRDEYASRLGTALGISPPKVWMTSAIRPGIADLPALRELLGRARPPEVVNESRQMAARQTASSLLRWLREQRLDERLAALERLENEAREDVMDHVGGPLVERITRRLVDAPELCSVLTDEAMRRRVARWPIVNILHVLLGPLWGLLRRRLSLLPRAGEDAPDTLVAECLAAEDEPASVLVRSTFARLQQSHPEMSRLYRDSRLWEETPAALAVSELRRRLGDAVARRCDAIRAEVAGGGGVMAGLARMLITVGAVVWFPFAQPVLEAWLSEGTIRNFTLLVVRMMGVSYLLKSVAFLVVYFTCLWLVVKWDTRRQVERHLEQWKSGANLDPATSLPGVVIDWLKDLLAPIRRVRERLESLVGRMVRIRASLEL